MKEVRIRMKLFYLSIAAFLCLSITACSSDKEYNTKEPSIAAPDASLNVDLPYSYEDKNFKNQEIIKNELTPPDDNKADSEDNSLITEVDLSSFFDGLSGAAVFLDISGNYIVYNKASSESRVSPCSTFKIISTLAAFESGVITPSQSVIAWDGTKWKLESWNKDLTITEAFQSSCVWYYRKLIDKIGKENMTNFIDMLDYGNCDTSQWEGSGFNGIPSIDGFWLESSLLISPQEQVDVIHKIFEGKTEIDKNNITELKKVMHKEDNDSNINIYGKTGTGKGGWFVGFFESDGDNTYFAVYLDEQEGATGKKAQKIAENIIQDYF